MVIKYKTKVNTNGNSYGLIIDTEKKQYTKGYSLVNCSDFIVKKSDIDGFIKYNLADFESVSVSELYKINLRGF